MFEKIPFTEERKDSVEFICEDITGLLKRLMEKFNHYIDLCIQLETDPQNSSVKKLIRKKKKDLELMLGRLQILYEMLAAHLLTK